MGDYELNLDDIDDELELHKMVEQTEDIDERKAIRARLKEVMAQHRAERDERLRKREQDREDLLRKKVADADEQKRRTLAMYDAMAKSAPAGGAKSIDVGILRTGVPTNQPISYKDTPHLDLVEEAIRDRQRASDQNKKKVLAAFDKAARSGPAGVTKQVDFDNVTSEDISHIENKTKATKFSSTFEMRGGVPKTAKAFVPKVAPRQVEPERDLMEEAIRKRQAEADERKRRTLDAYDQAARSRPSGGPINVYIPQSIDIEPVISFADRPKYVDSKPGTPIPPLTSIAPPSSARQARQAPQPPPKPVVSPIQPMNIKTQSVRSVTNPYQQPKPAAKQQPQPQPQPQQLQQQQYPQRQAQRNVSRTVETTQKTTGPITTQQAQRQVTITTQSVKTTQQQQSNQQQQYRQQQQFYDDDDDEEEEDDEDDYE